MTAQSVPPRFTPKVRSMITNAVHGSTNGFCGVIFECCEEGWEYASIGPGSGQGARFHLRDVAAISPEGDGFLISSHEGGHTAYVCDEADLADTITRFLVGEPLPSAPIPMPSGFGAVLWSGGIEAQR